MLSFTFIVAVVTHTPVWVWLLFAALMALGLRQAWPHSLPLARMTLLPLGMLGLSLWGVASAFGAGIALAAWVAGIAVGTAGAFGLGVQPGVRWSAAEQRLHMPGSWLPLALMMAIFCTKYGVGVGLALHPELRGAAGFAPAISLAYGVFSGLFVGRALLLLRLLQQRPRARMA